MDNPKEKKYSKNKQSTIIIMNVALLVVGGLIINYYMSRPEIKWLYSMLNSNYSIVKEYPKASTSERLSMKMGYNYSYLSYVKDNTPESAIILFPNRDQFMKQPTNFTEAEFNKAWLSSLVYPRKVVMDGAEDSNSDKITHVAIVNGWGYDKLNYPVSSHVDNHILPINLNKQ